jgi:hypothetical protein
VNPSELEHMSIKDLRDLMVRVDKAIEIAAHREKAELKAKLMAMAAEHGMSLADLVGDDRSSK